MIGATPSQRILVYEPDEHKRSLLGLVLLTNGYVVESAANEAQAHALCESFRPDLVLIGLSEPFSISFEVYDRFCRRHAARKVAFIPGEFKLCDLSLDGRRISQDGAHDLVHEIANMFTDVGGTLRKARAARSDPG